MRWTPRACRRFRALVNERDDRPLDDRENAFLSEHRRVCPECRRQEGGTVALNMLREMAIDAEPGPEFDVRVLRSINLDRGRRSLSYWSPAAVGAVAAAVAILAAFQLLTPTRAPQNSGAGEAQLERGLFPELRLDPDRTGR